MKSGSLFSIYIPLQPWIIFLLATLTTNYILPAINRIKEPGWDICYDNFAMGLEHKSAGLQHSVGTQNTTTLPWNASPIKA